MQKVMKKGLRLNEVNRKQIIAAVVNEKMGAELAELEFYRTDITLYVERALMERLSQAQELPMLDLTEVPRGVMPEIKRHYLGDGFADRKNLIEFSEPVRVPFQFYGQGSIASWEFKFNEEQTNTLRTYADKACDVEGRAKEMRQTMMTFLNGFTSPQKLLAAAPDFEKYLPEDMYGEEDAEERVSLDDLLGMTNQGSKPEPEVEEPKAEAKDDEPKAKSKKAA